MATPPVRQENRAGLETLVSLDPPDLLDRRANPVDQDRPVFLENLELQASLGDLYPLGLLRLRLLVDFWLMPEPLRSYS